MLLIGSDNEVHLYVLFALMTARKQGCRVQALSGRSVGDTSSAPPARDHYTALHVARINFSSRLATHFMLVLQEENQA